MPEVPPARGTVVLRVGDPVPPNQTTGKANSAGGAAFGGGAVGAALGALMTRFAVRMVEAGMGEQLGPDDVANVGILCTALGAVVVGAVSAWYGAWKARNYVTEPVRGPLPPGPT